MGLAASQARFLAITARKANCEYQSMEIAQQKLDITRNLQAAAQDYQNSLSATKLVWDTDSGAEYDLSYALLMTPSAINEYDAYLITDTSGKIVLSTAMYNAAVKAGVIDKTTGDPITSNSLFTEGTIDSTEDGSRNAFLYQLGVYNQADVSNVNAVIEAGAYTASGVGGDIIDKSLANTMTTSTFISYLSSATWEEDPDSSITIISNGASYDLTQSAGDAVYGMKLADLLKELGYTLSYSSLENANSDDGSIIITKNGSVLSEDEINNLTLGDLLTGKYEMTGTMSAEDFSAVALAVLNEMAQLLGMGATDVYGLNVGSESDAALNAAYEFSTLLLNSNYATSASGNSTMSKQVNNCITDAQSTNVMTSATNSKSGTTTSISLTNMLKSFLTYFAISMDGYDSEFNIVSDSSKKSVYATDDLSYYYTLSNDTACTDQTLLYADFYNQLYNQLCMNGACPDTTKQEQVTDSEYLNNALKNGQLFLSTLCTDGYYYQGHFSATEHVAEVTDDDAIARAEAEYNVVKSKLNYKEETLEIKLKNIDTELSALTTEYDTVKQLISQNVEKIFTMFSS